MAKHPLCAQCERDGRVGASQELDHIKPVKTHPELFWDESNFQALCIDCHQIKSDKESLSEVPGSAEWREHLNSYK